VTEVWILPSTVAQFYYRSVLVSVSRSGFGTSTLNVHLNKLLLCCEVPIKNGPIVCCRTSFVKHFITFP